LGSFEGSPDHEGRLELFLEGEADFVAAVMAVAEGVEAVAVADEPVHVQRVRKLTAVWTPRRLPPMLQALGASSNRNSAALFMVA
jgi:hypothetical protein